jgi:hypothetical protein
MRAEVGEVVTDASGAFEIGGLEIAATESGFLIESPHGELRRTDREASAQIEPGSPGHFTVATYAHAAVELRDALTDRPVWRARIVEETDPLVRSLRAEALGARFLVRWAVPVNQAASPARVRISAPGFEPQVVTLEPHAGPGTLSTGSGDATVVRLARGEGTPACAIHLRMPVGVRNLQPRAWGAISRLPLTGEARGLGTTATLINRGEYWEVGPVGDAARWRLPEVLGLSPPEYVTSADGELLVVDLTGPAWGRVELRLTGDPDLCRGPFELRVAQREGWYGSEAPITVDTNGRVDAGWWPPVRQWFWVRRSAESGSSEPVEVCPGPEPTVVEIPIRNLLMR